MSGVSGAISRAKATTPGAEFHALRAQAVALTQAMSGDVWTDYNFSDPGVTIIEQLCYALTELPYRAELPVQDLLCGPAGAGVQLRRQGLFPAWSILPCNPVTADDFRRVVMDRVPGVANAWFTPLPAEAAGGLSGLYDVAILPGPEPDQDPRSQGWDPWRRHRDHRHDRRRHEADWHDSHWEDRHWRNGQWQDRHWHEGRWRDGRHQERDGHYGHGRLIERVLRCYSAHRALCEDVRSIHVLRPVETRIHARVGLQDQADPSDTLAQALFSLGLALAPEPRRTSLDQQMARASGSADVFCGPPMLRGFIDDDQLTELPTTFAVNMLAEVLAETPGVVMVDQLSVELSGATVRYQPEESVPVPEHAVLRLRTRPKDGRFSITMVRNRVRCEPDPARVRLRLSELWRQQRRTYRLRTSYAERYATPEATHWDLKAYLSVQEQFPLVYGIGRGGLPPSPTATRRGQAKQLKGYLMAFDQLLADSFSQMAFIRDLFSIEAGGSSTYAWQSLRPVVPDAEPLLAPGYETGLASLTAETDPVDLRRNAILNMLLSFFALQVDAPEVPAPSNGAGVEAALIHAKQATLRHAGSGTRDRGRGVDYRRAGLERSAPGAEMLSRVQLELLEEAAKEPRPELDDEDGPIPVHDTSEAGFGRRLAPDVWPAVEQHFRSIEDEPGESSRPDLGRPTALAGRRVATGLLSGLHQRDRYRIGRLREPDEVWLVCGDEDGGWWLIAQLDDETQALRVLFDLVREAEWHRRRSHRLRLYFVEWILLRHAGREPGAPADEHGTEYGMRVSAVLSATADERDSEGWRAQATAILRNNTPAHVALDCLFLEPGAMDRFVRLHGAWVHALRHGPSHRLATASEHLERFLIRHAPAAPADEPQDQPTQPSSPGPAAEAESAAATVARIVAGAPTQTAEPSPPPTPPPEPPPVSPPPAPAPPPEPVAPTLPLATPEQASPPPQPVAPTQSRHWFASLWHWLFRGRASPPGQPSGSQGQSAAVGAAPPGAPGFDADTVLTAQTAAAFAANGFAFAIRYLSRSTPEAAGDLSATETAAILGAGLALMAVQHVAPQGWVPSLSLGRANGTAAAANAKQVGLPPGMCLWLDLEGVAASTPATAVIAYCNRWFRAVSDAGYLPGLYVGASCGLTSEQLGRDLTCRYYWQSGSTVPDVAGAGYCMVQTISTGFDIAGVAYDRDMVQADARGATPIWAAPASRSQAAGA